MRDTFIRARNRRAVVILTSGLAAFSLTPIASADQTQTAAVQGTPAALTAAGYGGLNGTGINIGIDEALGFANAYYGNGAANQTAPAGSNLLNGNSDLPGSLFNFVQLPALGGNPAGQLPRGPNQGNFPAGLVLRNHATEVAGVAIGQGTTSAIDTGIAPSANSTFAANGATATQNTDATTIQTVLQQPNTPVVNMSWGINQGTPAAPTNNGASLDSRFVDWAAGRYDALMVVAGNEGNPGAPSDTFNSINVAATGQRGIYNGGVFQPNPNGAILYYGAASTYNTTNMTSDVSPITGYGREKTDIVAPGGDPGDANGNDGIAGPNLAGGLTFDDQFQTTAGGLVSGNSSDTYNGVEAGFSDLTTNSAYTTNMAGNIQPVAVAGTSFAAPLVAGASALIYQDYVNSPINQGFSSDHRLMKAILLNGATHTYAGAPLVEADGVTPWTRLPGKGVTPLLAGTTAAQFGGSNPTVQPGLDPQLGTGMLNVVNSLNNYAAGKQTPGNVNPTGWDLNTVPAGAAANTITDAYTFNVPVSGIFSATLCWDAPVAIGTPGANNTWQTTSTLTRGTLTDLDLYLFQVKAVGTSGKTDAVTAPLGNNVDYSTSDIDNVEYLFDNLAPGNYQLDVANAQMAAPQATTYGLAWMTTAVPEPETAWALVVPCALLMRRRRSISAS